MVRYTVLTTTASRVGAVLVILQSKVLLCAAIYYHSVVGVYLAMASWCALGTLLVSSWVVT